MIFSELDFKEFGFSNCSRTTSLKTITLFYSYFTITIQYYILIVTLTIVVFSTLSLLPHFLFFLSSYITITVIIKVINTSNNNCTVLWRQTFE